jgi:hypothetical protein
MLTAPAASIIAPNDGEPPSEFGEDGVVARDEARGRVARPHRAAEVEDRRADAGERAEAAHPVVAQARLLEEAQEVGVGVLGDHDEVGAQRDEALEVGARQPLGGGRHASGHVRHVGIVGPARDGHEPRGREHLGEELVGREVQRGDARRSRARRGVGLRRGGGHEREGGRGERGRPLRVRDERAPRDQGRPPTMSRRPPRTSRPSAG